MKFGAKSKITSQRSHSYSLGSPKDVQGRKSSLRHSNHTRSINHRSKDVEKELQQNPGYSAAETHHIIRYKSNDGGSVSNKSGISSKARHAIKKRINKEKNEDVKSRSRSRSKSKSYATPSGVEATVKMHRTDTFSSKKKKNESTRDKLKNESSTTKSKLKSGSDEILIRRGRSIERRGSFSSSKLPRSLSRKRSISMKRPLSTGSRSRSTRRSVSRKRSQSRGRSLGRSVNSSNTGILKKVKSFRRSKSVLSVRSTRSAFSVKSNKSTKSRGKGFFSRLFRRKPKNDDSAEKVLFVKQEYIADTPPVTPEKPEETSFLGAMLCFPDNMCRDLFCRPEDVTEDMDKVLGSEDDPRDFGEEYSAADSSQQNNELQRSHPISV